MKKKNLDFADCIIFLMIHVNEKKKKQTKNLDFDALNLWILTIYK